MHYHLSTSCHRFLQYVLLVGLELTPVQAVDYSNASYLPSAASHHLGLLTRLVLSFFEHFFTPSR